MEEEKIRYGLKNDYMFRAAMQSNEKVLRGLVCALLDLRMDEIKECVIENPIILGEDIDDKTCILDVKILLNNDKRLNIELQTTDYGNWQDRSLFYLCRAFNELGKGKDYTDLKTTIHIGILDFTLFPDAPEFYSEYLLMNTKTHKIFNRKFALRVLDLTQLEKVSEEEKETDLYYWAKLFQSRSWEEITMLAEKNEAIREAAATIKKLNADEKIKMQCEAREQLEHDMASAYHHGVDVGEKRGEERGRKAGIRALERTN
ncbi:MAG: Rpn family recombination-promoting nuclease/putative transposase, partial [Lachnospiraceae bacterium]|nr:Rpn family recombination-promoting nuclease/putative transposase [Lachnospiraceae bacterium]